MKNEKTTLVKKIKYRGTLKEKIMIKAMKIKKINIAYSKNI